MTSRRAYRTRPEDIVPIAWTSPWTPTEAELTTLFLEIADAKGWPRELRYHTHDSRRSTEGYPDWHLIHPGQKRSLFVELKGFGGQVSDEQLAWIRGINDAGGEAYLVRTSCDYARDATAIAELLTTRPPARKAAA